MRTTMEIPGKVALVTGGAHRVGRALVLGLARAGADIVLCYHRSEAAAAATADEVRALGRRVFARGADVSNETDVRLLIEGVAAEFGRLDVVVNSASLFESAAFDAITGQDWDRVLGVNLKGPFLVAREAAPLLEKDGGGVIVNIADLSAFQTWPSYVHHSVSKAGLVHLTRVLARVLAPAIRVACIAPGTVLPPPGHDDEDHAGGRERRLTARAGEPEDVVRALLYLVESDFVTGDVLRVEGGRMLL